LYVNATTQDTAISTDDFRVPLNFAADPPFRNVSLGAESVSLSSPCIPIRSEQPSGTVVGFFSIRFSQKALKPARRYDRGHKEKDKRATPKGKKINVHCQINPDMKLQHHQRNETVVLEAHKQPPEAFEKQGRVSAHGGQNGMVQENQSHGTFVEHPVVDQKGAERGPCPGGDTSKPEYLRSTYPGASVKYWNIAVGEIDTTFAASRRLASAPVQV